MFKQFVKAFTKKQLSQGFSLIEIMIAITILAMIVGGISVGYMRHLKKARVQQAMMDIKTISSALDLYKTEFGRYPEGDDGLEALIREEMLKDKKTPKDPWGTPYVYVNPGVNNERSYDLYSLGEDGREGGGDDITNWDSGEED